MTADGKYSFNFGVLDDIANTTGMQVAECDEIWNEVMSRIAALFPEGNIDAGLNERLTERNEQYKRQTQAYMGDADAQGRAIRNTRQIAEEGGQMMRNAASM